VLGSVVVVTVAILALNWVQSTETDRARAQTTPPTPSTRLLATRGFLHTGVEQWTAFPGTLVTKGRLGQPTAPYAQVQRDLTATAATDPTTDAAQARRGLP
jgi:hypothetical protein